MTDTTPFTWNAPQTATDDGEILLQIRDLHTSFYTRDGVVTVAGVVPTRQVKREAEVVLMEVDGVREVVNYLQVVPELAAQGAG